MMRTRIAAGALVAVAGLGVVLAPSASATPLNAASEQAATACYRVTADMLNVRQHPNNNATILHVLTKGRVVRASVKITTGFRQVTSPVQGWSGSRFLARLNHNNC